MLELGSGYGSTPILHTACAGRRLVTADNSGVWMDRFRYLESPNHELLLVEDWRRFELLDEPWDVAFVDQAPGHDRVPAILRLRSNAQFIVVHDTEHAAHYGFEPLLSDFRYRLDDANARPRTTVVSDRQPIPFDLPSLRQHHVSRKLLPKPARLTLTETERWHELTLVANVALPHHFHFDLAVKTKSADLQAQLLFRTKDHRSFFWTQLLPARTVSVTVSRESEMLGSVGDATWAEVINVCLRARTTSPPARLQASSFSLSYLPEQELASAAHAR